MFNIFKKTIESEIPLKTTNEIKEVLRNFFISTLTDNEKLINMWLSVIPCILWKVCIDKIKLNEINIELFYTNQFKTYYKSIDEYKTEYNNILERLSNN